jgi:putrescine oxidase
VHEAYDNTNHGDVRGTLVGFISDQRADEVLALPDGERREQVLRSFAAYYGDKAMSPTAYYESQWMAEEWTAGAYGTSFGIGGLTRYRDLITAPVGPISFGTSDLPGPGFQHVDGAIRVGRRLAAQATR